MKRAALALACIVLLATAGRAGDDGADAGKLATDNARASYIFGLQFANMMRQQGLDLESLDRDAFFLALDDVASRQPVRLNQQQAQAAIQAYQEQMQEKARAAGQQNLDAGKVFLAANAKKEGVKTTASGLQYKVLEEGAGEPVGATDEVTVHYTGKLLDGSVFDSSVQRGQPVTFDLAPQDQNRGVIQGWKEGLQLMREGDKYRLFIPGDLAYGANANGPGGPNATLVFDVEVLKTKHKAAAGDQGGMGEIELPGM